MYAWVTWVSTCSAIWREVKGRRVGGERVGESEFSFWSEVKKKNTAQDLEPGGLHTCNPRTRK